MISLITVLAGEHREIEAGLDRLAAILASGQVDAELFRYVRELNASHYLRESELLAGLHIHEPALAAKLIAQHEEASEIAARIEESLEAGQASDVKYLARRFLAIAQHNIIEEERDIFPLVERCFGGKDVEP